MYEQYTFKHKMLTLQYQGYQDSYFNIEYDVSVSQIINNTRYI